MAEGTRGRIRTLACGNGGARLKAVVPADRDEPRVAVEGLAARAHCAAIGLGAWLLSAYSRALGERP